MQLKESGVVMAKKKSMIPGAIGVFGSAGTGDGKKRKRGGPETQTPFQLGGKFKNGMLYLDRKKLQGGGGGGSGGGVKKRRF